MEDAVRIIIVIGRYCNSGCGQTAVRIAGDNLAKTMSASSTTSMEVKAFLPGIVNSTKGSMVQAGRHTAAHATCDKFFNVQTLLSRAAAHPHTK
jgi:hypothetical protein